MRALVTGGAGFIGSHLVDALVARGDEVAVIDDLSTGRRANLTGALADGATLHVADIADAAALDDVVAAVEPEVVFHLAAQIDVRRSVSAPADDARVNVAGTINVLDAARRAGVRRVVYSSTGGAIYGDADVIPTPETAPVRPLSPYGQAKYAGEGYCSLYARLYGLSTLALRYANVYGPRQDPLGEGGVVAIFCGKAAAGGRATVFGDGTQTRDYVFVGDVVRANLMAASSSLVGCVNIGTGIETTVLQLLDRVRTASGAGRRLDTEHAPPRAGEVDRSCLAIGFARERLGWEPTTMLDDGLRLTFSHVAADLASRA